MTKTLKISTKAFLFLTAFLYFAHNSFPQIKVEGFASVYTIYNTNPIQNMPPPAWVIMEGEEKLTIEAIRSGDFKDARFIDLNIEREGKSTKANSYWFRIAISSKITLEDWKLLIERYNPQSFYDVDQAINLLTAYYFSQGKLQAQGFSGRQMPVQKRDVKDYYYQSVLNLGLAANDTLDIWINYKAPPGFLSPQVQIHPFDFEIPPAPWPYKLTTFNFYLGFLFTLFTISSFLIFWFKEKVYIWFLGFILFNIITILYWRFPTFLIPLLTPDNPVNTQMLGFMIDMTKWSVLLLFGRVFIQTKKYFPKVDKLLLVLGISFITITIIMISVGVKSNLREESLFLQIVFSLIMVSIIGVLGYLIFSKNALARFFSIGAIIPFLGILMIGFFRSDLFIRNLSELMMSVGPMFTLTLAIVYRFRLEVIARIRAEKEKNLLLEYQTKLLEAQVDERTQELKDSLENLKATQSQLVQQEKLASLGQLTAGIAHEIKNPLNFVNNFSEVSIELVEEALEEIAKVKAQNDSDSLEEVSYILNDIEANLRKIYEHGTRANSIVTSMLQHSRGGTGKMEPTDINALVKEFVNLAFHGMRARKNPINVDIQLDLDSSNPVVPVMAEDFSRVILNICNNAFDAMREVERKHSSNHDEGTKSDYKAKLSVRTKTTDGKLRIEIEDNGPGIPDEIKDKILQPFFTTKKGTEGTGLGLSITNDIVKAHGGRLIIDGNESIGTVCTIYLTK